MDRFLVLHLQASGCVAEAWLNDIPVLRTRAGAGACHLQVNEFVMEGENQLRLELHPCPDPAGNAPRLAFTPAAARTLLLLARAGRPASEGNARTLTELACAVGEGELYPASGVERRFDLPVKFPRWRWLDAPPIDASAAYQLVAAFVQELAMALFRGDGEAFIAASRVRLEELAVAYQMRLADITDRLRSRIQLVHATKARPLMPVMGEMQVRRCGGGKLLECNSAGEPALRTGATAEGVQYAWPLRVAVIEGRCHVFR